MWYNYAAVDNISDGTTGPYLPTKISFLVVRFIICRIEK